MWLYIMRFFKSKYPQFKIVIIDMNIYCIFCISMTIFPWFKQVLSAYEFEQHAGTKTRHPNNHIYLENGKPVYNIIQELKTAPLDALDEVIRNVAGSSLNGENFQLWKGNDGDLNLYKIERVVLLDTVPISSHPAQRKLLDICFCIYASCIQYISYSFISKK